jgi:3-keto-disaccharide hydrolase
MKSALAAASIALTLFGLCMVPARLRGLDTKAVGWVDIFPASSLKGWTRVAIPPNHPPSPKNQWSVDMADHTIVCTGTEGHEWLRYDRELGDFEFQVEWRLAKVESARNYNSGVFVRNSADGSVWYQAQIGSASGGYLFGDNPLNGSLRRFNLQSTLTQNPVKKAGEWNAYDIRCQGEKITLSVNGVKTNEFDQCRNLKGYLGLEAEGSKVEFRRLRIRTLP